MKSKMQQETVKSPEVENIHCFCHICMLQVIGIFSYCFSIVWAQISSVCSYWESAHNSLIWKCTYLLTFKCMKLYLLLSKAIISHRIQSPFWEQYEMHSDTVAQRDFASLRRWLFSEIRSSGYSIFWVSPLISLVCVTTSWYWEVLKSCAKWSNLYYSLPEVKGHQQLTCFM